MAKKRTQPLVSSAIGFNFGAEMKLCALGCFESGAIFKADYFTDLRGSMFALFQSSAPRVALAPAARLAARG